MLSIPLLQNHHNSTDDYLHTFKPKFDRFGWMVLLDIRQQKSWHWVMWQKMVSRGGLQSMFLVKLLVILALSLGGLLQGLGILPALLDGMRHY